MSNNAYNNEAEMITMVKGVIRRNVSPRRVGELELLGFTKEEPVAVSLNSEAEQTAAPEAEANVTAEDEAKTETTKKAKTTRKAASKSKSDDDEAPTDAESEHTNELIDASDKGAE